MAENNAQQIISKLLKYASAWVILVKSINCRLSASLACSCSDAVHVQCSLYLT